MSWAKNEPTAAARRCLLQVTDGQGLVSPGLDLMAAGAVFVVGVNSPAADLALGTCINVRRPLNFTPFTFTADASDVCTKVAHGMQTGDGAARATTTTTLPAGIALLTDYWFIKIDADTFKLASSLANAYAGIAVNITDAGTGTHTLTKVAACTRPIAGAYLYEATQAETNHDAPFMHVFVDGVIGAIDLQRVNNSGAETEVDMTPSVSSVWDAASGDGGHTYGDLQRGIARTLMARMLVSGTTYTVRNLANTKNSHHGTILSSGRDPAVIDDLT